MPESTTKLISAVGENDAGSSVEAASESLNRTRPVVDGGHARASVEGVKRPPLGIAALQIQFLLHTWLDFELYCSGGCQRRPKHT